MDVNQDGRKPRKQRHVYVECANTGVSIEHSDVVEEDGGDGGWEMRQETGETRDEMWVTWG
jgi:hypothetical protein